MRRRRGKETIWKPPTSPISPPRVRRARTITRTEAGETPTLTGWPEVRLRRTDLVERALERGCEQFEGVAPGEAEQR